ncbi:hypothetical protein [Ferrovibrio terrae]|uniref:Bbp19 family protein n=1 Tax=Ferrovibrio terrae TaxID=2594003 RepID=UPI0031384379
MADHAELARIAVQLFKSHPGSVLFEHLRARTVDHQLPASATEAELRDLEGQRRNFRYIENLVRSGSTQPPSPEE